MAMRIVLLTYITCLFSLTLSADPVWQSIYLSSFYFDKNDNWVIIMCCYTPLDSILVSSSTSKSMCRKVGKIPEYYRSYLIFNNDSMDSDVSINSKGDSVSIVPYYEGWQNPEFNINEQIIFGDYKNSIIQSPIKGKSIKRINNNTNYSICDSLGNCQGVLHGHIYDKNGSLITNGSFRLNPFSRYVRCMGAIGNFGIDGMDLNNDGTYSTKLYSVIYNIESLGICDRDSCYTGYIYYQTGTVKIAPLNFTMKPDTSIELDIYFLEDFTDIKKYQINSIGSLKIFPTLINDNFFHYEIDPFIKTDDCSIDLLNINCQIIECYKIFENTGELILPSNIPNGLYILQLRMNEKVYISKKVLVNRQ